MAMPSPHITRRLPPMRISKPNSPLTDFRRRKTLWQRYKTYRGIEDTSEELVLQPYHTDSSGKEPRYYQVEAINRVVEAVAGGRKRILIVMATGTGKNLYDISNHLAALEGKTRQENPVSGGPEYSGRSDPGQ